MKISEKIHEETTIIDALVISNWSREVFVDMHRGGLTAANCTCSVWEGFRATMANIARWKRWLRDSQDILTQIYTVADIERAKREGRVGIILGFQNTYAFEDRIENIVLFHELGVRFAQITYNTRNLVGSGCWETRDDGLSDYGREVVEEMNRTGIAIDLSHVGPRTTEDVIEHSRIPVAFTHCCPDGLKAHPRNKTDDQLRRLANQGGFVGVATYPPFLPWGEATTVDNCVEVFEYMIDIVGEDAVGIGTDFTQNQDAAFFEWLRRDKGDGRLLVPGPVKAVKNPAGLQRHSEYPNLTAAMVRRGWSEPMIRKVLGENWLRFLRDVWND
jgi:membrane dipeptidase